MWLGDRGVWLSNGGCGLVIEGYGSEIFSDWENLLAKMCSRPKSSFH